MSSCKSLSLFWTRFESFILKSFNSQFRRNYGEILHSVAKAPFEEVEKSKLFWKPFFPAASEVQVLDGPAILDRELQSRHWGGDLFISKLLLDLLHPSLRALCLVVKSKGRGQGESVNTSCNKTRRKKVQGGVCQGGMFFENRGQWMSRLCWWARGWSTPPPAQDWQMQV